MKTRIEFDQRRENRYICGGTPVRSGNIGGFGKDWLLIGGSIGGGNRPSTGIICDEAGDGIFIGCGLKYREKTIQISRIHRISLSRSR